MIAEEPAVLSNPLVSAYVLAVTAVLVSAAVCDLRTRNVPDAHWSILVCVGMPLPSLSILSVYGADVAIPHLAGSCLLAVYMLTSVEGVRAVPVVAAGSSMLLLPAFSGTDGWEPCASALASFLLYRLMYSAGLLTGGADAKCMMTLALVMPFYPQPTVWHVPEPVCWVLNPSVSVLVLALVLTMLGTIPTAVRNAASGDFGTWMFGSRRMPVDGIDPTFHWPVQRPKDGTLVGCRGSPDTANEILDALRIEGVREVRVTPAVPFIVPVAVSAIVVMVLGSPLAPFS